MAGEEGERTGAFKVQDRRRFDESGAPRDQAPGSDPPPAPASEPSAPAGEQAGGATGAPPPHIDFTTYVILLAQAALAHLGEIPHPIEQGTRVDLPAAQQVIEILAMLKEKTRSNLDPTEAGLLDRVIYDLRMKYVERVKAR